MLTLPQMAAQLAEWHQPGLDLFRFEGQPIYRAASDGGDYQRFLAGQPLETDVSGWLGKLRQDTADRKWWRRVRLAVRPFHPYVEYEAHLYVRNAGAGEDIRVLEVDETAPQASLGRTVGDFFVVGEHVMLTHYDDQGFHQHGEVVEGQQAAAILTLRGQLWNAAEPFTSWWDRHQEIHRTITKAQVA